MTASRQTVDGLGSRRPEWRPWLALVDATRTEAESGRWDTAVPDAPAPRPGIPRLDGAIVPVDGRTARRFFEQLIRTAARGGTPKMKTLDGVLARDVDESALLVASARQDATYISGVASGCGADPEALQAVVSLLALPLLQACSRCWKGMARETWIEGFCPTCGSWPAFAEVRGIERTRYLRCARCGDQWHALPLLCPYCRTDDHERLATLVPEVAGPHAIEVCRECLGYVKSFTRLQGCEPAAVMLEDLGSVELDVAVVSLGYRRPEGSGYPVDVNVDIAGPRRRFFAWNA